MMVFVQARTNAPRRFEPDDGHQSITRRSKRREMCHMSNDTGETEYGSFAPGSLQEIDAEEETETPETPAFDLNERFASATYKNVDGSIIDNAPERRSSEHICGTCYHALTCKHRPSAGDELMIVITRCLAYEPDPV